MVRPKEKRIREEMIWLGWLVRRLSKIRSFEKNPEVKGKPIRVMEEIIRQVLIVGAERSKAPIFRMSWLFLVLWIINPAQRNISALNIA